uniref:Uncharacterized protein n=1 Tax=Populus trichocarpa TaxID=3694 RepID=A0A2K2BGA7_POPTR
MKTTKPLPAHPYKQLRGGLALQLVTCKLQGKKANCISYALKDFGHVSLKIVGNYRK